MVLLESFFWNNFWWVTYFWPFGWRNAVWTALSLVVGFILVEIVNGLIDWYSGRGG
jgi:hypothetical protein